MHIQVKYHNMLRRRTGVAADMLELPEECSLLHALEVIGQRYEPALREMLFNLDGTVASHLVIFRNGQLARDDPGTITLSDGDELLLFPSISGG
jgi:molybdopterin converting factor small subunit